jgi:hypothetical protein
MVDLATRENHCGPLTLGAKVHINFLLIVPPYLLIDFDLRGSACFADKQRGSWSVGAYACPLKSAHTTALTERHSGVALANRMR